MQSLFQPLSDFFFWVLRFIHENLGLSWSWSIVVLTVIVRVVLIPLTWRQIKSMRAMQALQPQIRAIQEKYKEDRQVLNQKLMEFYQENKVSPFGSCLPLILQLPVFLGLYYMLRQQGTPGEGVFASPNPTVGWLWIHDITKFDIILMFLYIASQFVASWQTARNSPGQQKVIAYFMPVIVGIFMYVGKWPAGLFIYWFTSNLWTIVQQFVAERIMPAPVPVPAKVAPAAKTVSGRSAGKVGGKSGAEKRGKQAKATSGKSQRSNRGTGRPKGSRRT